MGKEVAVGKRIEKSIFWAEDVGVGLNSSNSGLLPAGVRLRPSTRVTLGLLRHLHGSVLTQFYEDLCPRSRCPRLYGDWHRLWFVAFYKETLWLFVKKWCLMLLNHKRRQRNNANTHRPCCFFPFSQLGWIKTHLLHHYFYLWKAAGCKYVTATADPATSICAERCAELIFAIATLGSKNKTKVWHIKKEDQHLFLLREKREKRNTIPVESGTFEGRAAEE